MTSVVRTRGFGRGLRSRVTLTFALGGLLLSVTFATIAYGLAQNYLLQEREATARRQTFTNARIARDALGSPSTEVGQTLELLELPASAPVVVRRNDEWFGSSAGFGQATVPAELRAMVESGEPGFQRADVLGAQRLVVGIPIPSAGVDFYELYELAELESTLATLRVSLFAGAVVVSAAAALLGVWASRRVLRPVGDVSAAAALIAGGDLSARLDPQGDPDLAVLATSFNTMVDGLSARIEREARFVSDVSHELKSPLTTLATCAQVLDARREALSERDRTALDLLLTEIGRFQDLVRDLLELGRADARVDALRVEPVRLGELVLFVTQRLDDPEFVVEIEPTVARTTLMLDKRRIERVLQNLLDNARVHGGGITRVTVRRHLDALPGATPEVWIMVDDAGPGVPVEERDAVFERFFRGAASGRRGTVGGSGIGLALVVEHVRVHGGRVWVTDGVDGTGARVIVALPWNPA